MLNIGCNRKERMYVYEKTAFLNLPNIAPASITDDLNLCINSFGISVFSILPESIIILPFFLLVLQPKRLKISKVIDRAEDCKSFVLVPDEEKGTKALAYFGAGKYLTVFETIEGMPVTRAYSISSSPKDSLEGKYVLTIKLVDGGLMSKYIFDTWEVGSKVEVSAPAGNFEYQPLRDAKKVICLAGGSGITPFVSMANAIADGDEDFELILLYGSRKYNGILFSEQS